MQPEREYLSQNPQRRSDAEGESRKTLKIWTIRNQPGEREAGSCNSPGEGRMCFTDKRAKW